MTGYAPTITQTNHVAVTWIEFEIPGGLNTITPSTGHLTMTGRVPDLRLTGDRSFMPATGHLAMVGYAPNLTRSGDQSITPTTGRLALRGNTPFLSRTGVLMPGTGHLRMTGHQPTLRVRAPARFRPTTPNHAKAGRIGSRLGDGVAAGDQSRLGTDQPPTIPGELD